MNVLVLLAIIAGLIVLRFLKPNILGWLAAWWVAIYLALRFGIDPPLPSSIVYMFQGIVTIALLAYLTATSTYLETARSTIVTFMVDRKYTVPLVLVIVLLPLLVALRIYLDVTEAPQPPGSSRVIHPPPPSQIVFKGKQINLTTAVNPYRALERSDPARFAEHVANGRRVYYENCVLCHGDDMGGNGMYAFGFDPIPANFRDAQTIGILQESYLFWRIAKGGPGLPSESTPWASAMPAWESFLTEEEIWDVILFLYDYTGQRPRGREAEEESMLATAP